jgi:hypothetical protein
MIGAVSMNDKPVVPPQVAVPAAVTKMVSPAAVTKMVSPAAVTKMVSPAAVAAAKAADLRVAVPKKAMGVFGLLLLAGVAYAATR